MNRNRTILLLAGLALFFLPVVAGAYPPPKSGPKDCVACHKLSKQEAETLVKKLNPAVTVTDVKPAPVNGLWQVEVEAGKGKHGAILLDFAKKYFLVVNQVIPIEAIGKPRTTDFSKLPLQDAIILGARGAKIKVAVFSDPDCPFCRKLHEEMKKVVAKRKDIAFYILLYPLPMHKGAYKKAQAIECSKSIEVLDDAFSGKPVPEPTCGNEQLERNLAYGRKIGVNGTPTLVRQDGQMISAALPADKLIEWIDGK